MFLMPDHNIINRDQHLHRLKYHTYKMIQVRQRINYHMYISGYLIVLYISSWLILAFEHYVIKVFLSLSSSVLFA